jgi:hypothetical protein
MKTRTGTGLLVVVKLWLLVVRQSQRAIGHQLARVLPTDPGGLQSGFSILRYVRRDFREHKSGPTRTPLPAPPGGPPVVLGSLVRRAKGLPSTRNWPFRRWPLPPTSPPQVIPKAI